jgi:predicted ester cyclase
MSLLEENKELVRRFFNEVMIPGNVDAVGDFLIATSFFFGFMQKFVAERATGLPDAQITIEELFGEDDKVTACGSLNGTNSGFMLGYPPTNKAVVLEFIFVFTIKDGKIISMRFASDMAQQLWLPASS